MLQNIYAWISAKSASCDMSSTRPRRIRINDVPNVELAIGSHNWTRAKRHSSRISRFIGTWELLTIPSELFWSQIHLQGLWNRFQFVLYQNSHHFETNLLNRVANYHVSRLFDPILLSLTTNNNVTQYLIIIFNISMHFLQ